MLEIDSQLGHIERRAWYTEPTSTMDWYPGHMKKARQEIAEAISSKDVVLEVLDARMPASSTNPVLSKLCGAKPRIKILSKSDLADPNVTQAWLRHFQSAAPPQTVLALALSRSNSGEARSRIAELCRELAPQRNSTAKTVRILVVGIPNVGKSTLINLLMERKVARVGDEPAVTKTEQVVTLKNGMTLADNAGILWPRMDESATLRLALGGALPDAVLDYESVGVFAAEFLLERYPAALVTRFKLSEPLPSGAELLERIGRQYGCLRSGGVIDLHKAADKLIHLFRSGALGRISLETPDDALETAEDPSDALSAPDAN
jgi:ribosome biogenesis GTPase A